MDLFEAIGMAGKFFQFIVQLLFQGDIDLVSPFAMMAMDLTHYLSYPSVRIIFGLYHTAGVSLADV